MLRCECGSKAKYIVFEDDSLIPLCSRHFDEYLRLMGEANTTYYSLDNEIDLENLIDDVNRRLKFMEEKYRRLLHLYHELKEKREDGKNA